MRFTTALVLLLQPADGLLMSAATTRSAGLALSPLAVPRTSIIEMGRVCTHMHMLQQWRR
jgi:hypothetical protein|tara:strand:- start:235 stop:414 length:180 start_codon:yes stop_codon:yes gene_type:complete